MQYSTFLYKPLQTFTAARPHAPQNGRDNDLTLLQRSPLAGYRYHRASGVWPFLRVGEPLRLVREPSNPQDPNAIAVYFRNDKLGYVPRRENESLAALMDRGERLEARIARLLETDNPWRRLRFEIYRRTAPVNENKLVVVA